MAELYKGYWSRKRDRRMREILASGADYADTARELGILESQVINRANILALSSNKASKMMQGDAFIEATQRENDARFIVAMAKAFQRGDHL